MDNDYFVAEYKKKKENRKLNKSNFCCIHKISQPPRQLKTATMEKTTKKKGKESEYTIWKKVREIHIQWVKKEEKRREMRNNKDE